MPTTPSSAATSTFMVVATFRDDANLADMGPLRAAEDEQLELLHSQGRVGVHLVAPTRRTAFIEVIASDEAQAVSTIATLPFGSFFDLELYPITA